MKTLSIDGWFLTGLTETAGSFTFSRQGVGLTLYFALRLPSADRRLLEAIRDRLEGGTIYDLPRLSACYLRICRGEDLKRVVAHFERFPLIGHKRRAYATWRQMVEMKTSRRSRIPWDRLHVLAERLSTASSARGRA